MAGTLVLVAVEDTDACERMCNWVLDNALQPEDKLHLLHVYCGPSSNPNLPSGDYFDQAHPEAAQAAVMQMLQARILSNLATTCAGLEPVVHLVQASMDPKTVGRIICSKAEQLGAGHVYVSGSHHTSKLGGLLGGTSVAEYCKQHCKVPLTIVEQAPAEHAAAAAGAAGQQQHP